MRNTYAIFILMLLFFGCLEPKWETFTNEKFSMSYPDGTVQQTQGDEVFKVASQGCQISVSKFEDQHSFSAFVNYIKGMWNDVSGLTIENEYVTDSVADFTVRASSNSTQYKGSIRAISCEGDTAYIVMVGCERGTYDGRKDMVDKIIDSVDC